MVEYKCFRCGYVASQKCNFKNHLNRKNICKPVLDDISIEDVKIIYKLETVSNQQSNDTQTTLFQQEKTVFNSLTNNRQKQEKPAFLKNDNRQKQEKPVSKKIMCDFCNKTFTRKYGLTCHLKKCKNKNSETQNILKKKDDEIQELKKIVEKLLIENKSNITNNINNKDSFNTNNTIIINNYGDENTKYITSEYILNLLKNKPAKVIPELIKYTHFNNEHPENQNIKITNKKEPYVKIMKNNKWELQNKEDTITDLIDRQQIHLMDESLEKKLEINCTKNEKANINRCNDLYESEDKEYMKRLYNESELVIINNS